MTRFPTLRSVIVALVITAVFVSISTTAQTPPPGSSLFLPPTVYPVMQDALSVAIADVNNDGKPDLLVTNWNEGVSVLLGNGDGTFGPAVTYRAAGKSERAVVVADFNGDGYLDAAVASFTSVNVSVLMGNGDGSFRPPVTYTSPTLGEHWAPDGIAAADVNDDGKPDLLVTNWLTMNYLSKQLDVMLNNGDGTFQPPVSYDAGGIIAQSVATSDLNGDGKLDAVVANWWSRTDDNSGTVGVLFGNGDGTFQPPVIYPSGGYGASSIAIADVDGDRKPDLVVANCDAMASRACENLGAGPGFISVLRGNGDGSFQPPLISNAGGFGAGFLSVADVNGDKKPDVLVTSCGTTLCKGVLSVLMGNGNGTFQAPMTFVSGAGGAWAMAVADLNADSRPDVALALSSDWGFATGGVAVLLNGNRDITAPTITLSASPTLLRPADGRLVAVNVSGTITDTGSGVNSSSIEWRVGDEYLSARPYGRTTLDATGHYSVTVWLPAWCKANDYNGRQYTMQVSARDNTGNRAVKWARVVVPHGD